MIIDDIEIKDKNMKKKEIIMVVAILAAALLIWGFSAFFMDDDGDILRITVDNELYGEYPLDKDQVIQIKDTNVCEIADGEVRMIEADCPDQICVKTNAITQQGGTIICLPNRVFLEVIRSGDFETPDAVTS